MARKILLADDSVTAQNMGRKILADAGYDVVTVNNGSAALKKIAELKPDLVILDVYMPGYSGLEVCQRLKESLDSSRIPVLLSVGKLEPFKPEEAQRVRADSYIVKPFEASELLGALSKLEDKIVPQTEASKPGRFARAVAAAEEVSRIGRGEPSDDKGWKNRIGFPHPKTEPEEEIADVTATSFFNPVNRDLRTVVETPAEIAAQNSEPKLRPSESAPEASVDVAALAPAGLPTDVTPEELAAIAAAAAQIEMLNAAIRDQPVVLEEPSQPVQDSPSPHLDSQPVDSQQVIDAGALEAAAYTVLLDSVPPVNSEVIQKDLTPEIIPEVARADNSTENETENAFGPGAATALDPIREEPVLIEALQDLPVTMAAAQPGTSGSPESPNPAISSQDLPVSGRISSTQDSSAQAPSSQGSSTQALSSQGSSRWIAVSVALQGDEATLSLDEEMQKAFAAFVAQDPSSAESNEPAASDAGSVSIQQLVAELISSTTTPAKPVVEAHTETPPALESVPENHEPVPEIVSPLAGIAVVNSVILASQELQPTPEAVAAFPEPLASGEAFAQIDTAQQTEDHESESQTVKSAAAAWASWHETHTAAVSAPVLPQPQPLQSEAPAESAAMAVAAGAELPPQIAASSQLTAAPEVAAARHDTAASQADHATDMADIAGIVDSVLADLRPRLMAEISRKMAEKKS
ncbi:MAG: response regulator [Candidatus Sulfotelmatobacter sp.]